MPDVETNIWQPLKDQGLKVIAVDSYSGDIPYPTSVADYFDYLGPTYPGGIEVGTTVYTTLSAQFEGSNPFPVDVIIDKDGTIKYIAREYDMNTMVSIFEPLL